ncbi:HD-GYP domain-containing protein [Pseudoduganella danionis]|uniref:HD domain-containing protein n=1 Tax=Pseudoduganella danionis TaxID=1890295 RepID=A0ABW9SL40_9BURK|nr:HD domain-containing phosphohydrolase [Pseudoduganella danionis]MTW32725.1 HD domain-containing protein [Pseudoduganella danionis]
MSETMAAAAPSVLRRLNLSNQRLEKLLHNLRNEHQAESELRAIALEVLQAVDIQPDIALASILLCQIAGSYAVRHCIETAIVTIIAARGLQLDAGQTQTLAAAALTMNVGMLRHNESFQHKQSSLSHEEMAVIRRHPEESVNLLKHAGIDDDEWISCVLLHHENDDGSGYPAGVASPEVTRNAKLLSLADRYCAQVSARNYRRSIVPDQALRNLQQDRQAPVDPELLQLFRLELGDYPPGTLVRLHNGELGVVSGRHDGSGGQPICCLRDADGSTLTPPVQRSSSAADYAISAALSEDEAGLRFSMKQIWGEQASL